MSLISFQVYKCSFQHSTVRFIYAIAAINQGHAFQGSTMIVVKNIKLIFWDSTLLSGE